MIKQKKRCMWDIHRQKTLIMKNYLILTQAVNEFH